MIRCLPPSFWRLQTRKVPHCRGTNETTRRRWFYFLWALLYWPTPAMGVWDLLALYCRCSSCLLGDAWRGKDNPKHNNSFNAVSWWGNWFGGRCTFVWLERFKIPCSFPELLQVSTNELLPTKASHILHGGTIGVSMLYLCCISASTQDRKEATAWVYWYVITLTPWIILAATVIWLLYRLSSLARYNRAF